MGTYIAIAIKYCSLVLYKLFRAVEMSCQWTLCGYAPKSNSMLGPIMSWMQPIMMSVSIFNLQKECLELWIQHTGLFWQAEHERNFFLGGEWKFIMLLVWYIHSYCDIYVKPNYKFLYINFQNCISKFQQIYKSNDIMLGLAVKVSTVIVHEFHGIKSIDIPRLSSGDPF